ncbi:MAG: type III pantothenate kinase [Gammaproteobacteria bacterium]|nr:type III pantothenate kinase [Gammaproteobacteria bacterium]
MKLLIDMGNQRTKLVSSERLTKNLGAPPSVVNNDSDTFIQEVSICLDKIGEPDAVWVASVSDPQTEQCLVNSVFQRWEIIPKFLRSADRNNGVVNHYANPAQLGVDRWAALIGAKYLAQEKSVIVVDAGTAVTLDYIDAEGNFRGGVIFPGVRGMQKALNMQAEKITIPPPCDDGMSGLLTMMNTDTESAVKNGAELAVTAAIESGIRRLLTSQDPAAQIVITGGDSKRIIELSDCPMRLEANLVLLGVNVISEEVVGV